jgi:hypothetical protein
VAAGAGPVRAYERSAEQRVYSAIELAAGTGFAGKVGASVFNTQFLAAAAHGGADAAEAGGGR